MKTTKGGGQLVGAVVHTAYIQDHDGASDVLASIRASFAWLRHVFNVDGSWSARSPGSGATAA